MIIMAIREVRRPAVALNWITISFIFPVIGFGLYLITSNPIRKKRRKSRLLLLTNQTRCLIPLAVQLR